MGLIQKIKSFLETKDVERGIRRLGRALGPDESDIARFEHRELEYSIERSYYEILGQASWVVNLEATPVPYFGRYANHQHNKAFSEVYKHLLGSVLADYDYGVSPGNTYRLDLEKGVSRRLSLKVDNVAEGHEIAKRYIEAYIENREVIDGIFRELVEIYQIDEKTRSCSASDECDKLFRLQGETPEEREKISVQKNMVCPDYSLILKLLAAKHGAGFMNHKFFSASKMHDEADRYWENRILGND